MRTLLYWLFAISVPVVGGGALQILPAEPARMAAARLWLKVLLTWILLVLPLVALRAVAQPWLAIALGAIAVLLCAATLFAVLDVITFYGLPGLRLEDDALLVKGEGGPRVRRYAYDDVATIGQVTSAGKSGPLSHVELAFTDGTEWRTTKRGEAAVPILVRFSNLVSERSGRPVSPTFGVEQG
ncbi:MAG: hypothetical protein E3J64_10130 [Anaerolineales bacterium]|nr:MAG: hypothetical protein E3J64_10130 [Anaerolineales bacterium]